MKRRMNRSQNLCGQDRNNTPTSKWTKITQSLYRSTFRTWVVFCEPFLSGKYLVDIHIQFQVKLKVAGPNFMALAWNLVDMHACTRTHTHARARAHAHTHTHKGLVKQINSSSLWYKRISRLPEIYEWRMPRQVAVGSACVTAVPPHLF